MKMKKELELNEVLYANLQMESLRVKFKKIPN